MKKRIASLIMCAAMVILAACGTGETKVADTKEETQKEEEETAAAETEESRTDQSAENTQETGEDPLGKYEEPVTVTWGVQATSVQQFKDGDTYEDNVWSRKIKEDLNIDLEVAWTADVNTDAYNNKVNLSLASGEIPDVFRCNYSAFRQAVEAGLLCDISDIYDQYAGEYMAEARQKYADSFAYATVDGRLYGIPGFNDNSQMATLLWIRQDWLDNLGMEAPTTMDELYDLAYAFTYNDPDGNGKNDTYGLGLHNQLLSADHASLLGLAGSFGVPLFRNEMYYRNEQGEMISPVIQDEMKEALRYVQKMYADGIIDPEFVVKDQSNLAEDIGEGKIGMAFGQQWGTWYPWNLAFENYGATVHAYPVPRAEGFDYKLGYNNNGSGDLVVISAACEHPEAVIKMFNHYQTICNLDMSPEVAAIYNDDEQYRFNPCYSNEPQETTYAPLFREVFANNDTSILPNDLLNKYNKFMDFEAGKSTESDAYGLWGVYSEIGSMHIIQTVYEPDNALVQSVVSVQPDSMVQDSATLEKITLQEYTKIITGADVDSTFDAYVESWKKAGGEQILKDLDEMYPVK